MNFLRKTVALPLLLAPFVLQAADPAPLTLEVRLLTSLTTRHRQAQDQPIQAMLIKPLVQKGEVVMPSHSLLRGTIRRVNSVGIGLRRERASLEINFTHWDTPDGDSVALDTTLLRIDNAREQVDDKGSIRGILAASNPLAILRGVWLRPSASLLLRAPAGLTGALGSVAFLGAKLLFTKLPDPEIDLPIGTEMTLQLSSPSPARSWGTVAPQRRLDPDLLRYLGEQATTIQKQDETPTADIINLALVGSAEMVEESFLAAGWMSTDVLDRKSFARAYKAFTQRQGYPGAPVSKLYYDGRVPDLVFQKSLNSIAKRHHIRLWRMGFVNGEEIWLGAATHDITVGFDRKTFGLLHKIDLNLDRERQKVTDDLDFAEAMEDIAYIQRTLEVEEGVDTDGELAVVFLKAPAPPPTSSRTAAVTPKLSILRRIARRLVLEARQTLLRENAYYIAYQATRKLLKKSTPTLAGLGQDAPRPPAPLEAVLGD